MSSPKDLTPEALQIYDRQRFLGLEVQRRLLNSSIFLTPLNGIMTELAKNLVLCGCNLVLYDLSEISQADVDSNFLVSVKEIGLRKTQVIARKLREMNPLATISEAESPKNLEKYDILAVSTGNFEEMRRWDRISKEIDRPVYVLWNCGFYGFFYASLGREFSFEKREKNQGNARKIAVKSRDFDEFFGIPLKKQTTAVFLAIKRKVMFLAEQRGLFYEPAKEKREKELEFLDLLRKSHEVKENSVEFLRKFARFYGIDYIPVYSVVGSVASQEFIKVIGRDQEPGNGWFCYDSEEGYGKFEVF